ncbi:MAG: S8 family serine peptidase [Gemmobacter sp.]|nr:S8 family serine peptidase [Gemmobacter sp.]
MQKTHFSVIMVIGAFAISSTFVAPLHAQPLSFATSVQSAAGLAKAGSAAPAGVAKAGAAAANAKIPPVRRNDETLLKFSPLRSAKAPSKTTSSPQYQTWMSAEIADAWNAGFKGQGATITVVDDFSSSRFITGNLGTGSQSLRHGEWTRLEASMIAPSATMASHDFNSGRTVALAKTGLNIANLSYGMFAKSGYSLSQISWSAQETSLINYATNGSAVVSKAAGNDAVAVGASNKAGNTDYLNVALVGTQSALFVGALDRNGTTTQKANLASYSNFAGSDAAVQRQFLTVGVRGDLTNLYGTSFAAPIVSGYAAVLGSKFTTATPTQIANRLLDTARTDTINGYSASIHGRGEASIARALAPSSID